MGFLKAYIASGWFNDEQMNDLLTIKAALNALEIPFYSPKDDNFCQPDESQESKQKCYAENLSAIVSCTFMICNTRDKDMGSIFEAGYASGRKQMDIIYYCEGLKDGFNLMLAQSGITVCRNSLELVSDLNIYKKGLRSILKKYEGTIE